jgi:hypothetical protein
MNVKLIPFFVLLSFLIFPVLRCNGQSSGLLITSKPYQWTDDMNRLGITTLERGLVLEIIIWNNNTESYPTYYTPYNGINLQITIEITNKVQPTLAVSEQINVGNLYLPPNGSDIRFLKITDGGGSNLTINQKVGLLKIGRSARISPF